MKKKIFMILTVLSIIVLISFVNASDCWQHWGGDPPNIVCGGVFPEGPEGPDGEPEKYDGEYWMNSDCQCINDEPVFDEVCIADSNDRELPGIIDEIHIQGRVRNIDKCTKLCEGNESYYKCDITEEGCKKCYECSSSGGYTECYQGVLEVDESDFFQDVCSSFKELTELGEEEGHSKKITTYTYGEACQPPICENPNKEGFINGKPNDLYLCDFDPEIPGKDSCYIGDSNGDGFKDSCCRDSYFSNGSGYVRTGINPDAEEMARARKEAISRAEASGLIPDMKQCYAPEGWFDTCKPSECSTNVILDYHTRTEPSGILTESTCSGFETGSFSVETSCTTKDDPGYLRSEVISKITFGIKNKEISCPGSGCRLSKSLDITNFRIIKTKCRGIFDGWKAFADVNYRFECVPINPGLIDFETYKIFANVEAEKKCTEI
jgi:hypothetical protein